MEHADSGNLISILRNADIKYLYHATHKDNIPSITSMGLLSPVEAMKRKVNSVSTSDNLSKWISKELGINRYVSFYLTKDPLNRSLSNRSHHADNDVVLEISLDVLENPGVCFCAASPTAKNDLHPMSDIELFSSLISRNWDQCSKESMIKTIEVYVPGYVSSDHIHNLEQEVSHKTLIMFVVDQHDSMSQYLGQGPALGFYRDTKIYQVAENSINLTIKVIIEAIERKDFPVKQFEIGAIGYGSTVASLFVDATKETLPMSEIIASMNNRKNNDNYVKCSSSGDDIGTFEGLSRAYEVVREWVKKNPMCHKPIIIHFTDGESVYDSIQKNQIIANKIQNIQTEEGSAIFVNIQFTPKQDLRLPIQGIDFFQLSPRNRILYNMSSLWPGVSQASTQSRSYMLNPQMNDIFEAIDTLTTY